MRFNIHTKHTALYSSFMVLAAVAVTLVVFPLMAAAQEPPVGFPEELWNFLQRLGFLTTSLVAIVTALALLAFIWGLVKFITSAGGSVGEGDKKGRTDGKKAMGWSIVAIFVMVSIWGIVALMQSAFTLESEENPSPPCLESEFFGGQEGC